MTGEEEEEAGERNRKGGRARGLRVVIDGRKTTNGRAMAGKEEESQRGGVMKCVPGSQLQASPVVLGRV